MYTNPVSRAKFDGIINEALNVMLSGSETRMMKGEYIAFFINRLCKLFMGTTDVDAISFNSHLFNDVKKKNIREYTDKLSLSLLKDDSLSSSEDFGYIICAVTWRALDKSDFAFHCYIRGLMEQIKDGLGNSLFKSMDNKDKVIGLRKFSLMRGIIGTCIDETYERMTKPLVMTRRIANGDIVTNTEEE